MERNVSGSSVNKIEEIEISDLSVEQESLEKGKERSKKLLALLGHPLRLLKEGGKLGLTGVKRFLFVVMLFALTNIVLFSIALGRMLTTGFEFSKLFVVFLVFLIGVSFTIYAGYRTYQYVLISAMIVINNELSSLFMKISETIVGKV
ncbi:MAG: hypothetical protein LAT76_04770, partial [Schleiferiaceae bacterium]|nr:hypothetical protein [Schleiferiaceae bacterium]